MIVLPQIGSRQSHFTTLLTILLLSCLVFYFIFSNSNIKKKKGGEFNDIWEVRQADGSPLKLEDVNSGLVGRRRISKFEDPEPVSLESEALSFNIGTMKTFPFVVAECMCDPPLKFVLPWWHPQIPNIMSQGGKLKPSSDMVFFKSMFSDIISSHTSNLTAPSPLMIDIGAQLGFVSLVAASLGIRSIAYEPNPEHAEKFRMSVALNGFNELITVVEAAVSDEAGDTQLSIPVDPRKGSEVRNFRLMDVQMVRADYSVEWLSLLEDIQLLRVWAGGLEYRVLRGASNLFKTNRVKAVLLRFWVEGILRNEDEPMGLLVYLADLGFVLKSMEREPTPYNMHLEFKRLVTLKKPTDLYWVKAERQN